MYVVQKRQRNAGLGVRSVHPVDRNIPLVLVSGFHSLGKQETGGRGSRPQDKSTGSLFLSLLFVSFLLPTEMGAK